jgi:Reverse transcriptase (RNA-dependent DNA polymerase)
MNQPTLPTSFQEARLRRLIATGYFPAELPPPFTTRTFAQHAVDLTKLWDGAGIRKFWTSAEHFSIPRYNQVRRKLSIVNPINQLHVAHLISENWDAIKLRLERSSITEFRPEIVSSGGGRAVTGVNFDGVSRRRTEILASYGRYVKTDIARFYPSIYTHSIAWAVLGKDWVKQNMNTAAFKTSFSNHIDKAISAGQSGQTIGIPIGPDTSRIVSELIATDLEVTARKEIPDLELRAVRYVDDLLVGLDDSQTADTMLAKLSAALYEYELELNAEKTSVHGIGFGHSPEWVHFIRSFEVSDRPARQREDLDSFFEQAIHLSDGNPRDNVLLFAARRAASFKILGENWNHLVRWLLYISRRSSTCLSFVVQHLSVSHANGKLLPLNEVRVYIQGQLPNRAEAAHTAEVAWLIFWARELGISIGNTVLERVLNLRSSACALLVLDMANRGLIAGKIDTTFWQSFATVNGLKSEMWLVAYEATRKAWWPRPKGNAYITSHQYFAELWSRDVQFYESARKSRPQVGPKFFQMLSALTGAATLNPYPD